MSINMSNFIQERRLEVGCCLVAGALLIGNQGKIREYNAQSQLERAAFNAAAQQVALIEAQEMAMQQAEPIAIARYERGCELIYNLNADGTYTALSVGMPIIKGDHVEQYRDSPISLAQISHSHVLPAGMEVCDVYGNTTRLGMSPDPALNGLPVVNAIATTTNKDVVQGRIDQEDSEAIKPLVKQ